MELVGKKPDEQKKMKVDMLMSRIPKRNLQNLDRITKLFAEIHKFKDNEIVAWVADEKDQNRKMRVLRELELCDTDLEQALWRAARAIENVQYPQEKEVPNG